MRSSSPIVQCHDRTLSGRHNGAIHIRSNAIRLKPPCGRIVLIRHATETDYFVVSSAFLSQRRIHRRDASVPVVGLCRCRIIDRNCRIVARPIDLTHTPAVRGTAVRHLLVLPRHVELIVNLACHGIPALVLGDHPGETSELGVDVRVDVDAGRRIGRILAADEELDRLRLEVPNRHRERTASAAGRVRRRPKAANWCTSTLRMAPARRRATAAQDGS